MFEKWIENKQLNEDEIKVLRNHYLNKYSHKKNLNNLNFETFKNEALSLVFERDGKINLFFEDQKFKVVALLDEESLKDEGHFQNNCLSTVLPRSNETHFSIRDHFNKSYATFALNHGKLNLETKNKKKIISTKIVKTLIEFFKIIGEDKIFDFLSLYGWRYISKKDLLVFKKYYNNVNYISVDDYTLNGDIIHNAYFIFEYGFKKKKDFDEDVRFLTNQTKSLSIHLIDYLEDIPSTNFVKPRTLKNNLMRYFAEDFKETKNKYPKYVSPTEVLTVDYLLDIKNNSMKGIDFLLDYHTFMDETALRTINHYNRYRKEVSPEKLFINYATKNIEQYNKNKIDLSFISMHDDPLVFDAIFNKSKSSDPAVLINPLEVLMVNLFNNNFKIPNHILDSKFLSVEELNCSPIKDNISFYVINSFINSSNLLKFILKVLDLGLELKYKDLNFCEVILATYKGKIPKNEYILLESKIIKALEKNGCFNLSKKSQF